MKSLLVCCLFFFSILSLAQDMERVSVKGKIKVPANEEIEGISVYNISSQKGAISDAIGEFTIEIADNDRLQITALQFESLELVVTQEDIQSGTLLIYLNPNVYKLGAAIIRTTDLSGYSGLDAKTIKTSVYVPEWDLSYAALEFKYNFENDGQTDVIGNAAEDALDLNSVPMARVDLGELIKLFFPKKNKTPREILESKRVAANALLDRYSQDYLAYTFALPEEKVNDFVLFAEENGLSKTLMRPENEIELLQFLLQQSKAYKKRLTAGG